MNRHAQRLAAIPRFVSPSRIALAALAVLGTLVAGLPIPSRTFAYCEDEPGARDTSLAPLVFEDRVQAPFHFDFDSGWFPRSFNVGFRAFFYASAGEADIEVAGNTLASYEKAAVIPGRHFPVDLTFEGIEAQSEYRTNSGLRQGMRYKYDFDVRWVGRFRGEDYLPNSLPIDATQPCRSSFEPFVLGAPVYPCARVWGSGDVPCWDVPLNLFGFDLPAVCDADLGWNPSISWGTCFPGPIGAARPRAWEPVPADEDSARFEGCFYAHPTTEVCLSGNLGVCFALGIQGKTITNENDGQVVDADVAAMTVHPYVGCEFARQSSNERTFRFTEGPFDYDASLLVDVIGKIEPAIKLCFAQAIEATIGTGVAVLCLPLLSEFEFLGLDFEPMDATFAVPVVEPVVCDIEPSSGTVAGGMQTEVTWLTSWGAPDSCSCRARLSYHKRPQGTDNWGAWEFIDDVPNTGRFDWDVPPFYLHQAELRVEFLDPNSDSLAVGVGGIFNIGVPCLVLDDGSGTVPLPPVDCSYDSFGNSVIVDGGLGSATLTGWMEHRGFTNRQEVGGGSLGGDIQTYDAVMRLHLFGTGSLSGVATEVTIPVSCQSHSSVRIPGEPEQDFDTKMYRLDGIVTGHPDFQWIVIRAGDGLGYPPSWGQTSLTLVDTGDFNVESFFDLVYWIEFVGRGQLAGRHGIGLESIRIEMGAPFSEETLDTPAGGTAAVIDPRLRAHPNPFNPLTQISFGLESDGWVEIDVYDVSGHRLRALLRDRREAGPHTVTWDGRNDSGAPLPSGTYFYRLRVDGAPRGAEKVILVK